MNTKLTLNVDKEVVGIAKIYAKKNKTSISKIVSAYLKGLDNKKQVGIRITPWVKELIAGKPINVTDKSLKNEYINYLENKYK